MKKDQKRKKKKNSAVLIEHEHEHVYEDEDGAVMHADGDDVAADAAVNMIAMVCA